MLMRLNLDKVTHTIHCYYPASGKKYFDRLRYGTIYHEIITVVEHPVSASGLVDDDGKFRIEAAFLDHGVDNIAWRITEADRLKFDQKKLAAFGVVGPRVRELQEKGSLIVNGERVKLTDVSWIRKGDAVTYISDTRYCPQAIDIAKNAKLLLCESTYLEEEEHLAKSHYHLTAKQAATIAKKAGAEKLILTHFSARYLHTAPFVKEAQEVFPNVEAAEDMRVFPFPINE